MNVKDRRILLFLQFFYLIIGLYELVQTGSRLLGDNGIQDLFEFQQQTLPFISVTTALVAGSVSLISFFSIWLRASWMYGFSLFTSGILLAYYLQELNEAIYQNSYEIIPIVLVVIVVLQSFPFLLRRSYRSM